MWTGNGGVSLTRQPFMFYTYAMVFTLLAVSSPDACAVEPDEREHMRSSGVDSARPSHRKSGEYKGVWYVYKVY